jgi:hypothetical protein
MGCLIGLIGLHQGSLALAKRPPFAKDPIPAKAIRLGDAFERVAEAVAKNPNILEALEEQDIDCSPVAQVQERFKAAVAAEVLLRAHLTYGELLYGQNLYTYIRDPETGESLQLDPEDWTPQSRSSKPFKIEPPRYIWGGMIGDYVVDPYEEIFCGPEGTLLHGAYRPVFLWRDEFERWLQKTFGTVSPKRRGRPRGTGSWEVADQPLVTVMHALIQRGAAKSALDAASHVVETAAGSGTRQSKITRLAKRYNDQFPIGEK